MKKFAIVPAKSRSTRLPSKNIKKLAGIPMVVRVIQTLRMSDLFDEVWVSTDSEEISQLCKAEGAKVVQRPNSLIEDTSTINDVCKHWLDSLIEQPSVFCCTYATSVFLQPDDYINAFKKLDHNIDGVMGVSRYNYPPVQAMTKNSQGYLRMLLPEYEKIQSQKHPDCVVSNGSQYWVRTSAYLKEKTFYLKKLAPYLTNEDNILDINTLEDFREAERRASILGWN